METVRAWRPDVPGIAEVFHANYVAHAYPAHTHDTWTLLIVDSGAIEYDLDRRHHGAFGSTVTLLPPHIPHDGQAATQHGFRKRVIYLEPQVLPERLTGRSADQPSLGDDLLRQRIDQLHLALRESSLEAESRLALICDRLQGHFRLAEKAPPPSSRLAQQLRDLLDADVQSGLTLQHAARVLGATPSHLVRSFKQTYGLPPHLYLTGRRVDLARRLLLQGLRAAEVAVEAGFHDQAHMTRHFRRHLGATPSHWGRSRA